LCTIITTSGDAYEFRVWATPISLGSRKFSIFTALDIRDEKRRKVLEHSFFHDINNIVQAILGFIRLFPGMKGRQDRTRCIDKINYCSMHLVQEISSHEKLLKAERGDLAVDISRMNSLSLLREIADIYADKENWPDCEAVVTADSDNVRITSDRSLLLRVLGNAAINALEDMSAGDTMKLTCKKSGSEVVFSVHNPGYIPRSVQLRLCQPAFTTKGPGRGIGTHSMKLLGEKYLMGKVWFTTSRQKGTTFYISVPTVFPKSN